MIYKIIFFESIYSQDNKILDYKRTINQMVSPF